MRVAIIGGSIGGLISALGLRRAGADVTLIDSDDAEIPERHDRHTTWFRKGTPHARQAHAFGSGFVRALRQTAPQVLEQLLASGVIERRLSDVLPPALRGGDPYPDDEDFRVISARRPHVEWHLRRAVLNDPAVRWRTAHVRGLTLAAGNGVPRVTGVETDDGSAAADVVIDASGRRSRTVSWLAEHHVNVPTELREPCDLVYRGRYYAMRDPADLPIIDGQVFLVVPSATHNYLFFPGDNGTLQAAMGTLPDDDLYDRAREPEVFHALLMSEPALAEWFNPDRAEPLTDVTSYAGLHNYLRRLVVDGEPLVTGLHLVGDAVAITNPQYGRGVSHAAVHARAITEIIERDADDVRAQALAADAEVTRMLEPSVRDSIRLDRERTPRWRAIVRGEEPPPPAPSELPEGITLPMIMHGFTTDPIVHRAFRRAAGILEPMDGPLRDPEILERLRALDPPDDEAAPHETLEDALRARAAVAELIDAI